MFVYACRFFLIFKFSVGECKPIINYAFWIVFLMVDAIHKSVLIVKTERRKSSRELNSTFICYTALRNILFMDNDLQLMIFHTQQNGT